MTTLSKPDNPNNQPRLSLCLNMIVKNESHIIKDTLEHLCNKLAFDYWVICDTGSTDNTPDIIIDFFNSKQIQGELLHHSWENFAHNRTLALQNAFNKTDLLLVFDADDRIVGDLILPTSNFNQITKEIIHGYYLFFDSGVSYARVLLINNRCKWKYIHEIHEQITCLEENPFIIPLQGNYNILSGRTGSRNNNPNKYLDDAKLLEQVYAKNLAENNSEFNHNSFYCANSYRDAGDYKNAIKWYENTLELKDFSHHEKYVCCTNIFDCYYTLGTPQLGLHFLHSAVEYDPNRFEHLLRLVNHYAELKQYNVAVSQALSSYLTLKESIKSGNIETKGFAFVDTTVSTIQLPIAVSQSIYMSNNHNSQRLHLLHLMYEIVFFYKSKNIPTFQLLHFIGNLINSPHVISFFCNIDPLFLNKLKEYMVFVSYNVVPIYLLFMSHPHLYTSFSNLINCDLHEFDNYKKLEELNNKILSSYSKKTPKIVLPTSISFSNDFKTKPNLLLFVGICPNNPNYSYMMKNGIGGSETVAFQLAIELSTKYDVYVVGTVSPESYSKNGCNVHFVNQTTSQMLDIFKELEFEKVIISRYLYFFNLIDRVKYDKCYIWAHDICLFGDIKESTVQPAQELLYKYYENIDGVICLTNWHANLFMNMYPILKNKILCINNSLGASQQGDSVLPFFDLKTKKTTPLKFVYTSRPERGLEQLILVWPQILKQFSNATLHISSYCAFPNPNNEFEIQLHNNIKQLDNIVLHGSLNKTELYNMISDADYWLYPTCFSETSCITSMEMMLHGVVCLYYPRAGLINTMNNQGFMINSGQELDIINYLESNQQIKQQSIQQAHQYVVDNCLWNSRIYEWFNLLESQNNMIFNPKNTFTNIHCSDSFCNNLYNNVCSTNSSEINNALEQIEYYRQNKEYMKNNMIDISINDGFDTKIQITNVALHQSLKNNKSIFIDDSDCEYYYFNLSNHQIINFVRQMQLLPQNQNTLKPVLYYYFIYNKQTKQLITRLPIKENMGYDIYCNQSSMKIITMQYGHVLETNTYVLSDKIIIKNGLMKTLKDITNIEFNNTINVLNLKYRTDRYDHMIKQLYEKGFKENEFTFVEGIAGNKLPEMLGDYKYFSLKSDLKRLFDNNNFNYHHRIIACALSHIKIWDKLLNDNSNDYYIVLEDDVILHDNIRSNLLQIANTFKNNGIEYLTLGVFDHNENVHESVCKSLNCDNTDICLFKKNSYVLWNEAFGYIISKQAVKKVFEYLKKCSIKCAIDNPRSYGDILNHYHINCLLIKQTNMFTSDIVTSETYSMDLSNMNVKTNNINNKINIFFADWWETEYGGGTFNPKNNLLSYILTEFSPSCVKNNIHFITNESELNSIEPNSKTIILFSMFGNLKLCDYLPINYKEFIMNSHNEVLKKLVKETKTEFVHFLGEPFNALMKANMNISFDLESPKNIRLPLWLMYFNGVQDRVSPHSSELYYQNRIKEVRKKFCSFVCAGEVKGTARRDFVNLLSQYKNVDCSGKYLNNMPNGDILPRGVNGSGKVEHNKQYRFAIAFENENFYGYVTEKICDVFKSGCIPIYWGTNYVINDFNPKCFINANDFSSLEELVEYVIKVDNDKELYNSYFKESIFSPKWRDILLDPNNSYFKNIAEQVLNPYSDELNISSILSQLNQTNQTNDKPKFKIFNIWHNKLFSKCYTSLTPNEYSNHFINYDVNPRYPKQIEEIYGGEIDIDSEELQTKHNIISEYKLSFYDPHYQLFNYCQMSCLYHMNYVLQMSNDLSYLQTSEDYKLFEYLNELTDTDYVGCMQYDMIVDNGFVNMINERIKNQATDYIFYVDLNCFNNPSKKDNSGLSRLRDQGVTQLINIIKNDKNVKDESKEIINILDDLIHERIGTKENNIRNYSERLVCLHTFLIRVKVFKEMISWITSLNLHEHLLELKESMAEVTEHLICLFMIYYQYESKNNNKEVKQCNMNLTHEWPILNNKTITDNYKVSGNRLSVYGVLSNNFGYESEIDTQTIFNLISAMHEYTNVSYYKMNPIVKVYIEFGDLTRNQFILRLIRIIAAVFIHINIYCFVDNEVLLKKEKEYKLLFGEYNNIKIMNTVMKNDIKNKMKNDEELSDCILCLGQTSMDVKEINDELFDNEKMKCITDEYLDEKIYLKVYQKLEMLNKRNMIMISDEGNKEIKKNEENIIGNYFDKYECSAIFSESPDRGITLKKDAIKMLQNNGKNTTICYILSEKMNKNLVGQVESIIREFKQTMPEHKLIISFAHSCESFYNSIFILELLINLNINSFGLCEFSQDLAIAIDNFPLKTHNILFNTLTEYHGHIFAVV